MFISDFGKSPVNLIESIGEEFYAVRDQQGNPHIVGLPSGADAEAGREYLASNQYTVLTGPMESIDAVKLFFKKQLLEHAIAQITQELSESKQLHTRYKRNRFKSLDQRRQEEEYLLRQAMLDVSNENKGSLEEIDRRGFLKGLGAAALAGATGMSAAGDLEDKIGPLPIMATIKLQLPDGTTKTIKKDLGHAYDYRLDDAKKDLEDLLNRKGIKNYSIHLDRYKDNSAYLDRETNPAAADYVDRTPLKGSTSDRAGDYMDNKPYKSPKGDKTYMDPAESVEEAAKKGLYYNVNKRKKAGTSRPAGHPKAPTAQAWKDAAKTAKNESVAEGLPQTLRKVVPGYAKREIDRKMDTGKFGKTDADKDANFQRYKKIQDKLKEQGVAEGLGKSIKRGLQGWGGAQDKPADIVKRNKSYDTDTAKKVRAHLDNAPDHTPAGLQKRVLDRKLKDVAEGWSEKYKRSINCASPKGFSQRAHCAGRKKNESVTENAEELNVGDPVIITGDVQYQGKTGDIADFGRDKRFVIVNLYNYGKHSFHSSDVEYNDYADSDDEQEYQRGVSEGSEPVTHRIGLTVTDPNHPMVSKRSETIQKTVRVKGDDREKAINSAIAHYRRKGYKVHDHHYIGIVDEGAKGAKPGWMLKQDPALAKKVKDSKAGYQALKKWAGKPVPKDDKQDIKEFAPPSGDDGDDGFNDETLKRMAAQWWKGDEDPRIERTLAAAGWEIGQDEGYDNGGVFVVQSGDENGKSYMSWPAEELEELDEGAGSMTVGMKSNHSAFKEEIDEAVERAAQSMAEDGYEFTEEKVRLDPKCWTGKKIGNPKTKMKGGVRVNNCVPK